MAGIPLFIVDAFAAAPFTGNPAAVCLLAPGTQVADARRAAIAAEMNLSETAFVEREGDGFRLRWWTPSVEVDLCGHATLATAHVLWQEGWLTTDQAADFATRSGPLGARRASDGGIALDFPATPPRLDPRPPEGLADALGETPVEISRSREDLVVELEDAAAVTGLSPDISALATIDVRGVIVTARGEGDLGQYDFVSRFFGPRVGVPEDPVTGSAHCALAPYWAERLRRSELRAYQASPRGGEVLCAVKGDRITLTGRALTTVQGQLVV